MFGFRPDGRRIRHIDPITLFTPYIMPKRDDSQVFVTIPLDFEPMAAYIREKTRQGRRISFMTILVAAYARAASQAPVLNRFIMNKQIFARNRLSVSFVVLRRGTKEIEQSLAQIELCLDDTIFDIEEKINRAIAENRRAQQSNITDKFAKTLLAVPGLATGVVGLARLLDRYGLMPDLFYRASPFHTSFFISNMGSLNMPSIYHHLYNFGTTSLFLGLGKLERVVRVGEGGRAYYKNHLPLGVVVDERVCGGAAFTEAFAHFKEAVANPASLERPPETIRYDIAPPEAKMARLIKRAEA